MPKPRTRRQALALAGGIAVATAMPGAGRAAGPEVGSVAVLLGLATRASAGGPLPLQAGSGVREGDEIATGIDSRLEILFIDGSLVTLGPETRLRVARFDPAPEVAVALIQLVAGIIKVAIGAGATWQSFQVETDTAVASVRATQWIMEVTATGSAVLVLEGQVAVAPRLPAPPGPGPAPSQPSKEQPASPAGIVLAPGEGTDVAGGGLPSDPKVWGPARREAALARVSIP